MVAEAISGCDVTFPHTPYGVQRAFMSALIRALQTKQNALLEAPTGCGKTLSLLCSCLAWHKKYSQALEAQWLEEVKAAKAAALEELTGRPADTLMDVDAPQDQDRNQIKIETDEDKAAPKGPDDGTAADGDGAMGAETLDVNFADAVNVPKPRAPQIFYCSRTHSQIGQVIRELKRSSYKPSMAILAARKHSCINTAVKKKPSIDEACEELLKENDYGCRYKTKEKGGLNVQVHDIEDLVAAGKKAKKCPYFASREMATTADLVFAPYSYLVDPAIREAMGIDTKNAVIILDEAHNIEDQAREAGSLDLELETLQHVQLALSQAMVYTTQRETYTALHTGVEAVVRWLSSVSESSAMQCVEGDRDKRQCVYVRADDIKAQLAQAGLDVQGCQLLTKHYKAAREYENSKDAAFTAEGDAANNAVPSNMKVAGAGNKALGVLSGLLSVLSLLHGIRGKGEGEGPEDCSSHYRLVIQRLSGRAARSAMAGNPWRNEDNDAHASDSVTLLGLWCMSPTVAFRSLAGACHSVILASGTLSPLVSFASELGVDFKITLEGRHVVDMSKQVWAGVLSSGPNGQVIRNTYQHKNDTSMHDDIGEALVSVCEGTPGGVLVFFPSYATMDQLEKRWQETGVWERLSHIKHVIKEPRTAGKAFDQAIDDHKLQCGPHKRGSVFMAVCRGKASEGIDFRDEQARAVIILGIPFPASKDSKVMLKKNYNDLHARMAAFNKGAPPQGEGVNRTPLSGDRWYELQAFRALNQAVGRCIRHRLDFGAILLMDVRFNKPEYRQKLPAWVRHSVREFKTFNEAKHSFTQFFTGLAASPPTDQAPTNPPPPTATTHAPPHAQPQTHPHAPTTDTPMQPADTMHPPPNIQVQSPITAYTVKAETKPDMHTNMKFEYTRVKREEESGSLLLGVAGGQGGVQHGQGMGYGAWVQQGAGNQQASMAMPGAGNGGGMDLSPRAPAWAQGAAGGVGVGATAYGAARPAPGFAAPAAVASPSVPAFRGWGAPRAGSFSLTGSAPGTPAQATGGHTPPVLPLRSPTQQQPPQQQQPAGTCSGGCSPVGTQQGGGVQAEWAPRPAARPLQSPQAAWGWSQRPQAAGPVPSTPGALANAASPGGCPPGQHTTGMTGAVQGVFGVHGGGTAMHAGHVAGGMPQPECAQWQPSAQQGSPAQPVHQQPTMQQGQHSQHHHQQQQQQAQQPQQHRPYGQWQSQQQTQQGFVAGPTQMGGGTQGNRAMAATPQPQLQQPQQQAWQSWQSSVGGGGGWGGRGAFSVQQQQQLRPAVQPGLPVQNALHSPYSQPQQQQQQQWGPSHSPQLQQQQQHSQQPRQQSPYQPQVIPQQQQQQQQQHQWSTQPQPQPQPMQHQYSQHAHTPQHALPQHPAYQPYAYGTPQQRAQHTPHQQQAQHGMTQHTTDPQQPQHSPVQPHEHTPFGSQIQASFGPEGGQAFAHAQQQGSGGAQTHSSGHKRGRDAGW